jgi:GR25 family glycosyltransferase involved in LPS biosynthesis
MATPAQNPFWQMIDGVFVINLDQRADRWTQFQAAASGIIPPEKLHRLPARLGREISGFGQRPWFRGGKRDRTWAARAGVTQSHRQALLKAREAGWRTVLILEDDVNFAPDFSALTTAIGDRATRAGLAVVLLGFHRSVVALSEADRPRRGSRIVSRSRLQHGARLSGAGKSARLVDRPTPRRNPRLEMARHASRD